MDGLLRVVGLQQGAPGRMPTRQVSPAMSAFTLITVVE